MLRNNILFGILFGLILLIPIGLSGTSYNVFAQTDVAIPDWVKKTAKYWVDGDVSDSVFVTAIEWLVRH